LVALPTVARAKNPSRRIVMAEPSNTTVPEWPLASIGVMSAMVAGVGR
jgi:hypothetical protein